jgi:hypothetical protein
MSNELNNAGRDFFHSEVYTNSNPTMAGRQEIVMFNGGTIAIPMTHVEECKGWHRDNTCTCPIDEEQEE